MRIHESICTTETKVDKFHVVIDMREQNIVRFQIEMEYLMAMQILQSRQQLTDKLILMSLIREIVWIFGESLS